MYIDILRRLMDAVIRKRPEKGRPISWSLLHDNAPAHRSLLVKDFLAENNVTTLEHSPYFPDLVPVDFYLFSKMKSISKGQNFSDATEIIKNVTEELRKLAQNGFRLYFRYPSSRCQKYICTVGLF
jgi:transposase